MKRIIGLTGGIGTGKTTVADYLEHRYQLPVLDADIYAREAVEPESSVLKAICDRYGEHLRDNGGKLNRQLLGEIIFNDLNEKIWLESQIHPFVRDRMESRLLELNQSNITTIVLVIPLLIEAKMTDLVTEIWVVNCPLEQQLNRLIKRNNLSLEQAQIRINNQMPLSEKIVLADVVLDNSSTLEHLYQQIDQWITKMPDSLKKSSI